MSRPHSLYRFYGHDDQLLYIGITMNPAGRWSQHAADKPWWSEVSNIGIESFPDRASVLVAEKNAIKAERPKYNVAHNDAPTAVPPGYLTLICDFCWTPVSRGVIFISSYAMCHAQKSRTAWESLMKSREQSDGHSWCTAKELTETYGQAEWEILHHTCGDGDEEAGADYVIEVDGRWTAATVLDWTLHLMDKTWLSDTDWPIFCRRILRTHVEVSA